MRPRSVPVNRLGVTTPGAARTPSGSTADDVAAPPPSSSVAGFEPAPVFAARSTPLSIRGSATALPAPATAATPSTSWLPAPRGGSVLPSSTTRAGITSSGAGPNSGLGDVLAGSGTGIVLISMFLTWYRVTITPLGVQFFESLERALFSRLFPQGRGGLGRAHGTVDALGVGARQGGRRMALGDPGCVDRHSSGASLGHRLGHDETAISELATHLHPLGSDGREPSPCCRGLFQSAL